MKIIQHPSPNFNARKNGITKPEYIMLHYTGMKNGKLALERLCDAAAEVSSHYVIETNGDIYQLVEESMRAWHAGVGEWHGITDMNSASIGIEIVNGGHDYLKNEQLPPYTKAQIRALVRLCKAICKRWNIPVENIIGHSDYAPHRKLDPGEHFPWDEVRRGVIARRL